MDLQVEEKPMTATERKALEKLIDGDFDALDRDLQQMAVEARAKAEEDVRESFAPRSQMVVDAQEELNTLTDEYNDDTNTLQRRFRDDKFALIARWKEQDVIWQDKKSNYGAGAVEGFTFDGLDDAITNSNRQVNAELSNARRVLEKERTKAQREVLLGGLVSSQARALIEGIPSATALFAAAMEERKELESGK